MDCDLKLTRTHLSSKKVNTGSLFAIASRLIRTLRRSKGLKQASVAQPAVTCSKFNAANKYSSAGHNEQKNKKNTSQIKFSAVTIKQQIKLVLQHSLCKNEFNVLFQVVPLRGLSTIFPIQSSNTRQCIITSFNKESKDYKHLLFVQ